MTNGYRSDGMRAWKQVGSGSKTYFLYDGGNPIIEMNSSGTTTAINTFGPDGLVARQSSGNWTYYTFDVQGNVAVRQSSDGTIQSRSTFDAYGQETATGSPSDPYANNGQWGYYLDRETGLYLCQHRYYDPANGRWLSRDPIGYAGGANLYGYCGGGPVGSADPSGLARMTMFGEDYEFNGEVWSDGLATSGKALVGALWDATLGAVNTGPAGQIYYAFTGEELLPSPADAAWGNEPGYAASKICWTVAGMAIAGAAGAGGAGAARAAPKGGRAPVAEVADDVA